MSPEAGTRNGSGRYASLAAAMGGMATGQYSKAPHFFDEVQSWAQRRASGGYDDAGVPEGRYREHTVAALAAEFARMATQVKQREDALRREIAELKIEIDQSKRKKQVDEITGSDYFQDIQAKAKSLRRKRE